MIAPGTLPQPAPLGGRIGISTNPLLLYAALGTKNTLSYGTRGSGPTANTAYLIPYATEDLIVIDKLSWFNGSGVAGNTDIGVYDAGLNLLVSSGVVANTGTDSWQDADVTDTVLQPGTLYYVAYGASSGSQTYTGWLSDANTARLAGCMKKASSIALPSSLSSMAAFAGDLIPILGIVPK